MHGAAEAARTRPVSPDAVLVGEPASPGRASGAVRIVRGPEDFRGFRDGEVLVARLTAPAWTPLFGRAAAVVTDGGTLAAHASLVAREYGIPAVVGTGDATLRLRDGQARHSRWRCWRSADEPISGLAPGDKSRQDMRITPCGPQESGHRVKLDLVQAASSTCLRITVSLPNYKHWQLAFPCCALERRHPANRIDSSLGEGGVARDCIFGD